MKLPELPFTPVHWDALPATEHPGAPGTALWRTLNNGDVRMRVGDRIVRWAEGETLVFDDTYDHEVWNDSQGTRVVLLVQFERPLRNPGKWIADLFLGIVRRSAFVQEARANIRTWNAAVKQLEA